jgi:hypothetical protein
MEPYQDGEDVDKGNDLLQYLSSYLFMDPAEKDLLKSSDDEEGIVFDETEEQENACADLMEQAAHRLYGRNHTEADICNLVHAAVRHFHPDRRFNKCLTSMMLRRESLVASMDQHPNENIIMEMDKGDDLI